MISIPTHFDFGTDGVMYGGALQALDEVIDEKDVVWTEVVPLLTEDVAFL